MQHVLLSFIINCYFFLIEKGHDIFQILMLTGNNSDWRGRNTFFQEFFNFVRNKFIFLCRAHKASIYNVSFAFVCACRHERFFYLGQKSLKSVFTFLYHVESEVNNVLCWTIIRRQCDNPRLTVLSFETQDIINLRSLEFINCLVIISNRHKVRTPFIHRVTHNEVE